MFKTQANFVGLSLAKDDFWQVPCLANLYNSTSWRRSNSSRQETGWVGGGACLQIFLAHILNFSRLWLLAMGGSSSTLHLGATFLESGFTSATPRPSSSEPNKRGVLGVSIIETVFKHWDKISLYRAVARLPAHRLEFNYFSRISCHHHNQNCNYNYYYHIIWLYNHI